MGDKNKQNLRAGHFSQPACNAPRMAQLLLRYDELDAVARAGVMRHASSCPQCGPRAQLFQAADRWLDSANEGSSVSSQCPESEELYNFGRGPGYVALESDRHEQIEIHLGECESCRGFTATLEGPIPIPFQSGFDEITPEREPEVVERVEAPHKGPRRLPKIDRLPMWLPVAVAAGLIVIIQIATRDDQALTQTEVASANTADESQTNLYPVMAVLRGKDNAPLLYPRGKVLMPTTSFAGVGTLTAELVPVENAELYRVRVLSHSGGAFDPGSVVQTVEGTDSVFDLSALELEPGHYTWTASAFVRGLERPLGERDFTVVDDLELKEQWSAIEALPQSERGARRVTLLHEHGYFGAARSLARSLPESTERDAYLTAWPGR
ncbi:MAG: hypothetical protein ACI8TQ_003970 [Planctomycetota bacterium]|jgi:hypothetical protein